MKREPLRPVCDEPLSRWTTLGLGGTAEYYLEAESTAELLEILRWARREDHEPRVLGGGSNLVVDDDGVRGVVVRVASRGFEVVPASTGSATVRVAAGEPWDGVVERAVGHGLVGLECLSGIPGTAGATPIQNVGAYGTEISDLLSGVEVLDLRAFKLLRLHRHDCGFAYRSSRFRQQPGRFVVVSVELELRRGGPSQVHYAELRRALDVREARPEPHEVRAAVLELRRSKGMIEDPESPGSAGSFFVNPVVCSKRHAEVSEICGELAPGYPVGGDDVKIPAAWLVERAGFARGMRRGAVGVSPHHALALVHYGGGNTAELLALAREIRRTVTRRFGVILQPEPVFWGFASDDPLEDP